MDVALDKFGRLVIPKKLRDRLGIGPGSKLRLNLEQTTSGERLALEPVPEEPALIRDRGLLVHTGRLDPASFDLREFMEQLLREREQDLMRGSD